MFAEAAAPQQIAETELLHALKALPKTRRSSRSARNLKYDFVNFPAARHTHQRRSTTPC